MCFFKWHFKCVTLTCNWITLSHQKIPKGFYFFLTDANVPVGTREGGSKVKAWATDWAESKRRTKFPFGRAMLSKTSRF